MRRAWILSLIIAGLGTSILWAQGPPPPPPEQDRAHGKPAKPNRFFKIIGSPSPETMTAKKFLVSSGWFPKDDTLPNQDIALDDALEKARDQVATYLHDQKLVQDWTPKVTFVRDRLLTDLRQDEVVGQDVKGQLKEILIGERFRAVEETRKVDDRGKKTETRRVWLKVVFNGETWKQIQKENRLAEEHRRLKVTEKRMVFLVKILAGIVALLLTICGYIRLDEWSKGYYTKWLKLAAVACVAVVIVFLGTLLAYTYR